MKGRKPRPTNLKVLTGNPGKRPISDKEPMPDANIPVPPSHLDAYALEEWDRLTPVLLSLRIISDLTMVAVAAYCDAYSDWRAAAENIANGDKDASMLRKKRQARADMVRYASEFGGTEVAKARLGVDLADKKTSKFDGLLNAGQKK